MLARQEHEAPRRLFRRGLWSLGRRWRFPRRVTGAIAARRLRSCRHQRSRDVADQSGVRTGSSNKIEESRAQWLVAPTLEPRKALAAQIQARAFETVPYV